MTETMKTVIGLFDDFPRAHDAVDALLFRKFDRADISLVANEVARGRSIAEAEQVPGDVVKQEHTAAADQRTAASASGMLGMLAGFGALTLPAIGPILAAGPMLGMLAGVAVDTPGSFGPGGLVAALGHVGAPRRDAEVYAEGVRRGGTLVIVRVVAHDARVVAGLLADLGAVDVDERRRDYEDRGFTGFDARAEPYTGEEIDRERALHPPPPEEPEEDEDEPAA